MIVGGADGFIVAFAQVDGHPLRRLHLDAPVTGLIAHDLNLLAVATRQGLLLLDQEWCTQRVYPYPVSRLLHLTPGKLMIVREDGVLDILGVDQ